MNRQEHISILGGGPAGLTAGYYAKIHQIPFTIYEAEDKIGGMCKTVQHGEFFYDVGAHRFHDKIKAITDQIKTLLGKDLQQITIPSQIYSKNQLIDFPLSPLNLFKNLGPVKIGKAAYSLFLSRLFQKKSFENFEKYANYKYGPVIAEQFLLNYSEKLWGIPCRQLAPDVSGKRLKGLSLQAFLTETIFGGKTKTKHLDGSFYYPKYGNGMITDRLAEFCGNENIRLNSRVTKIFHTDGKINAIEINNKEKVGLDFVINTLPISTFVKIMFPQVPDEIVHAADELFFQNLLLVILFINKNSVTKHGTIYFPEPEFPFTRVFEPKNRSRYMSPPGKTSLVTEIPWSDRDKKYINEKDIIETVITKLKQIGWIDDKDIIESRAQYVYNAYPVLTTVHQEKLAKIFEFLRPFNATHIGRNAQFRYTHLHDMIKSGKECIESLKLL